MVANQPGDSCDSSDAGHTNLHREPEVEVPSSAHQPPLDRAVAAHFSEVSASVNDFLALGLHNPSQPSCF